MISSATEATEFAITDTKLYVPAVILSTKDNIKLWTQLEYDLKRTVNQNKCQSKLTDQEQNRYFEYLINPIFQRVNILFVSLFENRTDRKVHTKYYIPKVEKKIIMLLLMENIYLISQQKCFKNMILERLQLVKEMIRQLAIY